MTSRTSRPGAESRTGAATSPRGHIGPARGPQCVWEPSGASAAERARGCPVTQAAHRDALFRLHPPAGSRSVNGAAVIFSETPQIALVPRASAPDPRGLPGEEGAAREPDRDNGASQGPRQDAGHPGSSCRASQEDGVPWLNGGRRCAPDFRISRLCGCPGDRDEGCRKEGQAHPHHYEVAREPRGPRDLESSQKGRR